MTKAKDIMRPPAAVLPVDRTVAEAVAEELEAGGGQVVAIDDDQVAGVIDPALLSQIDLGSPQLGGELIGNLVSLTFRTCRPDDDAAALREVFDRSGAASIVVVAPDGRIEGVVAPSDLPGAVS